MSVENRKVLIYNTKGTLENLRKALLNGYDLVTVKEEQPMRITPPRYIVWSTDGVDLSDPFQRKWYLRQVLLHGRAEDIRTLDLEEVAALLDDLNLPLDLYRLWKTFLETRSHAQG